MRRAINDHVHGTVNSNPQRSNRPRYQREKPASTESPAGQKYRRALSSVQQYLLEHKVLGGALVVFLIISLPFIVVSLGSIFGISLFALGSLLLVLSPLLLAICSILGVHNLVVFFSCYQDCVHLDQ